jgi:tetratricopeptide (TPR) repeat protein
MIQPVLKSHGSAGLIACACVVIAALGGYAFTHPATPKAIARDVSNPGWVSEIGRALDRAQAQHKDVLFRFAASADAATGGTEASLLDSEEFRGTMSAMFVLVRLAPSREASPAHLTEITTWAQRLGVARFPTFVLLDAEGRPYAKSELGAVDVASYQREFQRLREIHTKRDQTLALASRATGLDRAKLLDQALTAVAPFADSEYAELERQIVKLDPQNALGFKSKYESAVVSRELDAVIQNEVYPLADRGKYAAAIARLDRLIAEAKSPRPQLQLLTAFKGQLYYSLGDKRRAARFLDDAIAIDPQSESAARARAAKLQLAGLP